MIAFALEHARAGRRVLPLDGKRPIVKSWQDVATTDEKQIRRWWQWRPKANCGLLTGAGFWVLDEDQPGMIADLEAKHGALPITVEAVTGSLKRHVYFKQDDRVGTGSICAGLDFRGAGGQVVAPGSRHPTTGRAYTWEALHDPSDTPFAPAPTWLIELVAGRLPFRAEAIGPVAATWLAIAFRSAGWLGDGIDGTRVAVRCPRAEQHSDGRGLGRDASTVILAPTSRTPLGAFACAHGHCADLSTAAVLRLLPFDAVREAMIACPVLAAYAIAMFHPKAA